MYLTITSTIVIVGTAAATIGLTVNGTTNIPLLQN